MCWRRTYFGKFSIRTSTGSLLALKIFSISGPTICSCSVRSGLDSVLRVIRDPAALALALDARLLRPLRRVIAGGGLQRAHEIVGAALSRQLLQTRDRPVEVFGAEAPRRDDLPVRGVVVRLRGLVRYQWLFVQALARTQPVVDDIGCRPGSLAAR